MRSYEDTRSYICSGRPVSPADVQAMREASQAEDLHPDDRAAYWAAEREAKQRLEEQENRYPH